MLPKTPPHRTCRLVLALAVFALAIGRSASADDRQLLRKSTAEPYVLIVLDTSGSMNWAPPCSAADFAAGACNFLCPTGDCYVPKQGDDPASKTYQAKQAIVSVLRQVVGPQYGFATYNQDDLYVRNKHWLYSANNGGPSIPGFGPYPVAGAQEVFGLTWSCTSPSSEGCTGSTPADLTNSWQAARVQRLSKGNTNFNTTVTVYVKPSTGITYKVDYAPTGGGVLGNATIQTSITVSKCTNGTCSSTSPVGTTTVTWANLGDFLSWDAAGGSNTTTNPGLTYFGQGVAADAPDTNTCSGWDPNTDTVTGDQHLLYSLRFPTVNDSFGRGANFSMGDVIPLDWKTDHNLDIQGYLAPNLVTNPGAVPDTRIAAYFNDLQQGGDSFLRLKNSSQRPLIPSGATPLGATLQSIRTWYSGCTTTSSCGAVGGWKAVAAAQDSSFACRPKYILFITDGDETCSGDPCGYAKALHDFDGVTTIVFAFGVDNTALNPGNKLDCMATSGSGDPTAKPKFPKNQNDLVNQLKATLDSIREQASAFASAAVPSVQAQVTDKIYLTSFVPLNDMQKLGDNDPTHQVSATFWSGHVNAFLKPLPLTSQGLPDVTPCANPNSPTASSCLAWDSGAAMLNQSFTTWVTPLSAVTASSLAVGSSESQRRVIYTLANPTGAIPSQMQFFATPPTAAVFGDANWTDLWNAFNFPPANPAAVPAARDRANNILQTTLITKHATQNNLDGSTTQVTYVLGDIFHADPRVVTQPTDFFLYSSDSHGSGSTNCTGNRGYRCWANLHQKRRQMLLIGANDGQLHAFDAGLWNTATGKFDSGTGEELFSYVPRLVMPIVRSQAEGTAQIFSVDGSPAIGDVFIDPKHPASGPVPTNREWRTVVVGGLREGGSIDGGGLVGDAISGYYALDITQPDVLGSGNAPVPSPGRLPSCLNASNLNVAPGGCGTLPFPSVLWEFTDSVGTARLDEDANGAPDLGATWSVPTIARIKVTESGNVVEKWVAIFGGGFDAVNKPTMKSGNYIYIVDIETGKPIYKHRLTGSVVADPAVIDMSGDDFTDTIYIATTAGFLYKMDISKAAALTTVTLPANATIPPQASSFTVTRVTDTAWDPFPIFSTGGLPIYLAPTAFFLTNLNRAAIGFGTGNREDLWTFNGQAGRFYLIVDDNFTSGLAGLPKTEATYQPIDVTTANAGIGSDFVLNPASGKDRGWFLRLDPDERVITQTFGVAGILIFSSFQPQVTATTDALCAHTGTSRAFVLFLNTGNSVLQVGGSPSRFFTVPEFVTNPFINQSSSNSSATNNNSETLDATQIGVLNTLKTLAPHGAKFLRSRMTIDGIRADTKYFHYAAIQLYIIPGSWKEF